MSHRPQPQVQSLNAQVLTQDLTTPTPTPPRHQRAEALTLDHTRLQQHPEALTLVPTSGSGTNGAVGRMTHLVSNFCGNHNDDIDINDVGINMQSRRVEEGNVNLSESEHGYQPLHKTATMNVLIARVTQA